MNPDILLLHPDGVHVIGSNLRVLLLAGHPGLTRLHGLRLGAKVEYPGYPKNTSKTSPVWAMVGIVKVKLTFRAWRAQGYLGAPPGIE